MEYNQIQSNPEYIKALQLLNANGEKLKKELDSKQIDLFELYCESSRELSNITELDAFQAGFKIAMRLILACIKE